MFKNMFLFLLAGAALFFSTSLSVLAYDDKECASVFEKNCGECHKIEKGCYLIGQSKEAWLKLFDFMAENGAVISEDERELMSSCLVKPGDAVKQVCKK